MSSERYCDYCGAPVNPAARFCPSCGQIVRSVIPTGFLSIPTPEIPPTQKVDEPTSHPPQYQRFAENKPYEEPTLPPKKSNRIFLIGGIAALALIICLGVGVVAIGSSMFGKNGGSLFSKSTATDELGAISEHPTEATFTVTEYPTEVVPTEQGLTGRQQLGQSQFFDDFSSTALGWPQNSDDNYACGYQNGGFFIEVKHPDYRQVIFSPVKSLTHLEFTAEVFSGSENGGFGVACYYQDINNFYFVFFYNYLQDRSGYTIGRFENGAWKDPAKPVSVELTRGPQRFAVECTQGGVISVFVNGTLSSEQDITQPFPSSKMHLFVMTFEGAAGGTKVIFDDVYGYQAMQ